MKKQQHLTKETLELENPILIFINPVSGGGFGTKLIQKCKNITNLFVVKLPDDAETFHETYSEIILHPKLRCIACGGDGTVGWVMNILSTLYENEEIYRPPMAVIPLGTGNDMSNSLGWGSGVSSSSLKYIYDKIKEIATSDKFKLIDRWAINIQDNIDTTAPPRRHLFCNYFSIGVDAGVTYEYAEMRSEKNPSTRLGAFALYIPAGAHFLGVSTKINEFAEIHLYSPIIEDTEKKPKNDKKSTKTSQNGNGNRQEDASEITSNSNEPLVEMQNEEVEIFDKYPPILFEAKPKEQTITFLSSRNMYAGRLLWRGKHKAEMSDGRFEILLNKGSMRLAMTNLGFVLPRSYGQARAALIVTNRQIYYQVDGEAFKCANPSTIRISRHGGYPFILPIHPMWRIPSADEIWTPESDPFLTSPDAEHGNFIHPMSMPTSSIPRITPEPETQPTCQTNNENQVITDTSNENENQVITDASNENENQVITDASNENENQVITTSNENENQVITDASNENVNQPIDTNNDKENEGNSDHDSILQPNDTNNNS